MCRGLVESGGCMALQALLRLCMCTARLLLLPPAPRCLCLLPAPPSGCCLPLPSHTCPSLLPSRPCCLPACSSVIKASKFGPFPESLVAVYIQQVLQVGCKGGRPGGWPGNCIKKGKQGGTQLQSAGSSACLS